MIEKKLYRIQEIDALRPGKRVHSTSDWLVPATSPEEALALLKAHITTDSWRGVDPVYYGPATEWPIDRPWTITHSTISREQVAKLVGKS